MVKYYLFIIKPSDLKMYSYTGDGSVEITNGSFFLNRKIWPKKPC